MITLNPSGMGVMGVGQRPPHHQVFPAYADLAVADLAVMPNQEEPKVSRDAGGRRIGRAAESRIKEAVQRDRQAAVAAGRQRARQKAAFEVQFTHFSPHTPVHTLISTPN